MSAALAGWLAFSSPAAAVHGGQPADGAAFDAFVIIRKTDGRRNFLNDQPCSGTIISPRWVLTADHCIADIRDSISVTIPGRPGRPAWTTDTGWNVSGERFVRQGWLTPSLPVLNDEFDLDVGLIQLDEPAPLTAFPSIASPAELATALRGGRSLAVIGFGLASECGEGAPLFGGGAGQRRFGQSRVEPIRSHGGQPLRTLARETADSPACMNHGDSGGPLLDWGARKVLGVVSRPDTVVTPPPSLAFAPTGRGVFATVTPYWCDFFHEAARRTSGAYAAELRAALPWCGRP